MKEKKHKILLLVPAPFKRDPNTLDAFSMKDSEGEVEQNQTRCFKSNLSGETRCNMIIQQSGY